MSVIYDPQKPNDRKTPRKLSRPNLSGDKVIKILLIIAGVCGVGLAISYIMSAYSG